jgi:hypothetical protein
MFFNETIRAVMYLIQKNYRLIIKALQQHSNEKRSETKLEHISYTYFTYRLLDGADNYPSDPGERKQTFKQQMQGNRIA